VGLLLNKRRTGKGSRLRALKATEKSREQQSRRRGKGKNGGSGAWLEMVGTLKKGRKGTVGGSSWSVIEVHKRSELEGGEER